MINCNEFDIFFIELKYSNVFTIFFFNLRLISKKLINLCSTDILL